MGVPLLFRVLAFASNSSLGHLDPPGDEEGLQGLLGGKAKVADLAGHVDIKTTQGYRHPVRPSLPHAIKAWDNLLAARTKAS